MSNDNGDLTDPTVQSPNGQLISICFEDPGITTLFSELLRGRGVATKVLAEIGDHCPGDRIITEPQFYLEIQGASKNNCLLIGNKNVLKDLDAVLLSRPLTEEKIEGAIREFMQLSS